MDWMTRQEAADYLGVTPPAINYYLYRGRIEWKTDGPKVLVKPKIYRDPAFPVYEGQYTTFSCIGCGRAVIRKSNGKVPQFCTPVCREKNTGVEVVQSSQEGVYIVKPKIALRNLNPRPVITHPRAQSTISTLANWTKKAENYLRSKA